MDVRRGPLQGIGEDQVHQADDRRLFRARFEVCDIEVFFLLQDFERCLLDR